MDLAQYFTSFYPLMKSWTKNNFIEPNQPNQVGPTLPSQTNLDKANQTQPDQPDKGNQPNNSIKKIKPNQNKKNINLTKAPYFTRARGVTVGLASFTVLNSTKQYNNMLVFVICMEQSSWIPTS